MRHLKTRCAGADRFSRTWGSVEVDWALVTEEAAGRARSLLVSGAMPSHSPLGRHLRVATVPLRTPDGPKTAAAAMAVQSWAPKFLAPSQGI
jgi:hypothetical protein